MSAAKRLQRLQPSRCRWLGTSGFSFLIGFTVMSLLQGCGTDVPEPANPSGDPEPPTKQVEGPPGEPGASPFMLLDKNAVYLDGNVGIGTDAPACRLEVAGGFCTDAFRLSAAPAEGLVLKADDAGNGSWQPDGISLPYQLAFSHKADLFDLRNFGDGGAATFGVSADASTATALTAKTVGLGHAASFIVDNVNNETSALDVQTNSNNIAASAIHGACGSTGYPLGNWIGVFGESEKGIGVAGTSKDFFGMYGISLGEDGVFGATLKDGKAGVHGRSVLATGDAVFGEATGTATGVHGISDSGLAGLFENTSATSSSPVVSVKQIGFGNTMEITASDSGNGGRALQVLNLGGGPAVFAQSTVGNAVWGIASNLGGAAVIGDNYSKGEAVVGRSNCETSGAVTGRNDGPNGIGVRGFTVNGNGIGVLGQCGMSGWLNTAGKFENVNAANNHDVLLVTNNNAAVVTLRVSTPGSAGNAARFEGNVAVLGNLSKPAGSFQIDHPLDPENKYLYHSFVESPDMMNIYNGIATLDGAGEAWVSLPDWFEALNGEYRYQLTAMGAPGPNLYVAEEVTENKFKIAGGTANGRVSWQVTGVRHDAWAMKHRIPLEVEKSPEEKGKYLHPSVFDKPAEMGIDYQAQPSVGYAARSNRVPLPSEAEPPAPQTSASPGGTAK